MCPIVYFSLFIGNQTFVTVHPLKSDNRFFPIKLEVVRHFIQHKTGGCHKGDMTPILEGGRINNEWSLKITCTALYYTIVLYINNCILALFFWLCALHCLLIRHCLVTSSWGSEDRHSTVWINDTGSAIWLDKTGFKSIAHGTQMVWLVN